MRSWLKTISAGTLFNETLYYNDTYGGSTPQYGGNLSAITWKADSKTRGYKFTYDVLSRLTKAQYMENGSASSHYNTEYTYDKMGNILTLKRNGKLNDTSYPIIDNLTFTYTGNQVTRIDDSGSTPTYTGAFNFVNGVSQSNEYTYDKNGNLTKDLNKNISSIQYNLLNLPTSITYSSGKSATYIYDATGRKLRTSYKASASATAVPTDYCGNMIYENGVLKQILVDGGYISFSGSAPYYHFYLKDHLGNNCVALSPSGTAEQVNHYYPFGGLLGESTGNTVQRFRYNGKELDRTHGIDWYDYGARHMTPDAGRFTTIDPMAEKYYNTSPYAYCGNNPVSNIDLKGDTITYIHEGTRYKYSINSENPGFYDSNANKLNSPFANVLTNALRDIQSGDNGNKLINYLCSYRKDIYINPTAIDNETSYNKGIIDVKWNPDDNNGAGLNELNSLETPPFITLAHELYHAEDYARFGFSDQTMWYSSPNGIVTMSEYYTSVRENRIRKEHGLPLRRYYSIYSSGKPYPYSIIPKSVK